MNNSLSGSSLLTVCPYRRLPSDWKNRHVSMASWISPALSFSVFPISRVSRRTRSSLCSINNLPMLPMIWPRVGAGVEDQPGNADFADFNALCTSSLVDRGKTPRQSARIAGFFDSNVEPSDAGSNCPPIILYPRIIGEPLGFSLSIASNPVSSTWGMIRRPRLFT